MTSVRGLERIMDNQLGILRQRLESMALNHGVFDLKVRLSGTFIIFCCCLRFFRKEFLSSCMLDGLGEMAFARSFGAQKRTDPPEITAIHDHILLSCAIGQLPLQAVSKVLISWSPIPRIRNLIKSRNMLKKRCEECVQYRILNEQPGKDLLGGIINAKDPETGASLSRLEVNTEAFAML